MEDKEYGYTIRVQDTPDDGAFGRWVIYQTDTSEDFTIAPDRKIGKLDGYASVAEAARDLARMDEYG